MAVSLQIYEYLGGSPSTETITNANLKSIAGDKTNNYVFYPLQRPELPTLGTISYNKYVFVKFTIGGATTAVKRIRWIPTGTSEHKTRTFYGLFNTFTTPITTLDGRLTLLEDDTGCIVPRIGSGSPMGATSLMYEITTPGTYYTEFLVTQLYVDRDPANMEIGNTDAVNWKLTFDEYHA